MGLEGETALSTGEAEVEGGGAPGMGANCIKNDGGAGSATASSSTSSPPDDGARASPGPMDGSSLAAALQNQLSF